MYANPINYLVHEEYQPLLSDDIACFFGCFDKSLTLSIDFHVPFILPNALC